MSIGICDGISYLHSKHIAHRDLKPENILVFETGNGKFMPKIADFGTSKVIQTMVTNTSMAGTPKYAAPEILEKGRTYGASVDIYSLAMILFEIFSGEEAYKGR